ncbi:PfaD family polyunsaturated fatty acid/polyketide biosynthesis protein [Trichlorobacter ammonificans]|uniref:2-nitropropane dioxygenase n=2 Tax=Trichlorobacter ammonificans TaxID=2916410 RepID=A0ABN8HEI0_9BACT|nr:PfaD family polyunsaturated fatty acid/polyketide biosynthesis protein [Trichlorobacter ammonificans]CAH2031276.1 2-nitropropane dioxygenase [Trichlorobacter ammonificans]
MPLDATSAAAITSPGWYLPDAKPAQVKNLADQLRTLCRPVYLIQQENRLMAADSGIVHLGCAQPSPQALPLMAHAAPCPLERLGDAAFCVDLGIRYPYLGGSMAKGISSAEMALELGRAGMLGFFGAAGLPLAAVESAVDRLLQSGVPFGCNLIHSPHEPDLEAALAELFITKGVRLVEASAFLKLTLPLVRYRLHGIHRAPDGSIVTPNRIIAKVSREELAERFFSPPPEKLVQALLNDGLITPEQAELAAHIPMAQDITAEADSGGHTDNRPALALFPTIRSVALRMQQKHGYSCPLRVGLGGGIGSPEAAAAAFTLGAAWIMVGSAHQACVESGTSDTVRAMLAETRQADVTMAPAADMFEMGVTVQVLKRGTMFPMRAARLFDLYRSYGSLEDIPAAEREKLEKTLFLAPLEQIWQETRSFFLKRDPAQVERAEREPKHRMALVFRWYLGQAAHWAKDGDPARKIDYQVWCGPAMGAFNEWTAGTFLARPEHRTVRTVALNLLFGAAVISRANQLRCQGVQLDNALRVEPLEPDTIKEYLR